MKQYDIVVVGAGPGGYVAAIKARQLGFQTALIEKNAIGGVCLNWGCIPTKALLKSAKVFQQTLHAQDYGILVEKELVRVDHTAIIQRKNKIVKRLTGGVKMLLEKNGVDIYQGHAVFVDPLTIQVGDITLKTKDLILATGASPMLPPIEGLKENMQNGFVKTSKEMLDVEKPLKHLVIIGGGVIGVEFASIHAALGAKVTIIEKLPTILSSIDDEIRDAYLKSLKRQKIDVIVHATVTKIAENAVTYELNNQRFTIECDQVLAALGMVPNTSGMETFHFEMDGKAIKTNAQCQTSQPHVYAIGDVNGKSMLAHTASHEAIVAVETIAGLVKSMNYHTIPSAIYGFPEIVTLGFTEQELKKQKREVLVSRFPISANGKSLADGETEGFIKIIADPKYHEILGVHILASNATEIIPELTLAMNIEATAEEIVQSVHMHPTLSEVILEAAMGLLDKPIHL